MRYAYGLLLMLACACGGGGGTPAPTNGTSPLQDTAQQVIEGCGFSSIENFVELLEIFEGLLDPDETSPTQFMVLGVDPGAALVNWGLDLDGDQQPDLMGTFQFTDADGEPELSAAVDLLMNGFDDLDSMIASLPDGTRLVISAVSAEPPPFDMGLTIHVLGGAVDSVDGIVNVPDAECLANLDFDGVSFADVGGDYPSLTLSFSFVTPDGAVDGTLAFDGTNLARAEVTLGENEEVFAFLINLDTGEVTPTQ